LQRENAEKLLFGARLRITFLPQEFLSQEENAMRTILKGILLSGALACVCTSLVAQNDAKSSSAGSKKPASEAAAMPMPKPDPQMTKMIKMMGGNWAVTEKSDPSPMFPKGGSGKGTAMMTAGPGGMSLMEKYHSTGMMGGNFNGFGTFWWDAKANAYRGVWCDTMTPGGCDSSGMTKWDGANLVGTMEGEMNGQKMVTKFIYSDWKPNSFVMKMMSGPDAKSMKDMMTITYTRVGASSAQAMKESQ
jgi:Protein of unknown function (DUF1579)